ncbi:hydrophobin-251 [Lyophyllum atratum]|nr:hydrophobin-251 [Lyophyllum atratum]
MFARASAFLLALPLLAAALPGVAPAADQCNTGDIQCCNSTQNPLDPNVAELLGLLSIVASGVKGQVGLDCNPIQVIGVAGNSCTSQPVCCTDNQFNGLVAVGCTPINANV